MSAIPPVTCSFDCTVKWTLSTLSLGGYYATGILLTGSAVLLAYNSLADNDQSTTIETLKWSAKSLLLPAASTVTAATITTLKAVKALCDQGCEGAKKAFSESWKPGGYIREALWPINKKLCCRTTAQEDEQPLLQPA
ncbi:MAG: hypothetical protein KGJ02_01115 [Verrucomicrobiota bacterium]|nr:hypothetical protein [Verrucomicrobiota bacterium]